MNGGHDRVVLSIDDVLLDVTRFKIEAVSASEFGKAL